MSGMLRPDASNLLGLWRGFTVGGVPKWMFRVTKILNVAKDVIDMPMGLTIAVNINVELEMIATHWPGEFPFPYAIKFTSLIPHPMNPMARGLHIDIKSHRWELRAHAHRNVPPTLVVKGRVTKDFTDPAVV